MLTQTKKEHDEFEREIFQVEKDISPILLPAGAQRNLLVFVNPESGSGKAYKIFRDEVIPMFTESNTRFHLVITDRTNCAREIVNCTDLSQWTAIVIVSGDGLLNEVINGLMERPDWETAIKTPLGIIPSGSGNGLARSVFYQTGEHYEGRQVPTAIANIIQGSTIPFDLVRVETRDLGPIYSFLSCGMGIMSDIDIESERLRATGEARFSLYAIIRAINLRLYKARVSFLPLEGFDPNHKIQVPSHMYKISRSQALSERLSWKTCFKKFPWWESRKEYLCHPSLWSDYLANGDHGKKFGNDCSYSSAANGTILTGSKPFPTDVRKHGSLLPPLSEPVPSNWVVMEGDFALMYATYQVHLGKDVFFTPFAKPNDGIIWLALIYKDVTRLQMIDILSRLSSGTYINSDKVDMIPVRAFRLEPLTNAGHLTIDGELIDTQPIQAEVLPSIARVISRNSHLT